MEEAWWAVKVLAGFAGAIVVVYVLSRIASCAYFRTKYEHHRRVLKEFTKEKE